MAMPVVSEMPPASSGPARSSTSRADSLPPPGAKVEHHTRERRRPSRGASSGKPKEELPATSNVKLEPLGGPAGEDDQLAKWEAELGIQDEDEDPNEGQQSEDDADEEEEEEEEGDRDDVTPELSGVEGYGTADEEADLSTQLRNKAGDAEYFAPPAHDITASWGLPQRRGLSVKRETGLEDNQNGASSAFAWTSTSPFEETSGRLYRSLGAVDAARSANPGRQDLQPSIDAAREISQLQAELATAKMNASQSEGKASGLEADLTSLRMQLQAMQETLKDAVGAEDVIRLTQQYEEARILLESNYRTSVDAMQRENAAERALLEDRIARESCGFRRASDELEAARTAHDAVVIQANGMRHEYSVLREEARRYYEELRRIQASAGDHSGKLAVMTDSLSRSQHEVTRLRQERDALRGRALAAEDALNENERKRDEFVKFAQAKVKELKAALHASRGTSANLKHELDEANAKLKKMQGGRTRSSPPSHTIHSGGTSRSQSAEAGDRYPIFAEYAGLDGHATRPDFTAMFGGVAMRGRTSTMTETARPKAKAARVKREQSDPPDGGRGGDAPGAEDGSERPAQPKRKGRKPGGGPGDPDPGGGGGGGGPPSRSSSSSSHSSASSRGGRRRRHSSKKVKEADSVKIPALPKTAAQFLAWQNCVRDNVVSASGRSLKAYQWILEVEDPSFSYDRLALPGSRWETLDDKIRSAVSAQLTGELGREVTRAQGAERVQHKRPLRGRQMLRLVYGFYETKQSLSQVFGLTDLLRVHLVGDNLEAFINSWLHVLDNLKNPTSISDEAREELFLLQCEKSQKMASDVEHYKRLPAGDRDKSYAFLIERLQTRIKDERERRNRHVLERSLSGAAPPDVALPGATAKPPCRNWKKGSCAAGSSCPFGHDPKDKPPRTPKPEDRDQRPPPPSPGKGKGKGKGRGDGKTQSTSKGNPESKFVCYKHNSPGGCHNANCKFAHRKATAAEREEMNKAKNAAAPGPAAPPAASEGEPKKPVCPQWHSKGECEAGTNCKLGGHPKKQKGPPKRD